MIKSYHDLTDEQKKRAIAHFISHVLAIIVQGNITGQHFSSMEIYLAVLKCRKEVLGGEKPWTLYVRLMTEFESEIKDIATDIALTTGYFDNEFATLLSIDAITPKVVHKLPILNVTDDLIN